MMARRKPEPRNGDYTRATIPLYHYPTANRKRIYTLADGGVFQVRLREWTWRMGYIYYVDILKPSQYTGRLARRVWSEFEILLMQSKLAVSTHGKAA